jgi:hypothetical protein
MKLYTPMYINGWKIQTLDSESLQPLGTGHLCVIKGKGTIYNRDHLYTTKDAAVNYIINAPVPRYSVYIPAWTI